MKYETIPASDWLIKEGEPHTHIFRISKGSISVYDGDQRISTISPSHSHKHLLVGVFAAISTNPNHCASVSIKAETQVSAMRIPLEHIKGLIKNDIPDELTDEINAMRQAVVLAGHILGLEKKLDAMKEVNLSSASRFTPEVGEVITEVLRLYKATDEIDSFSSAPVELPESFETISADQWLLTEDEPTANIYRLRRGKVGIYEEKKQIASKEVLEGERPRIIGITAALSHHCDFSVKSESEVQLDRIEVKHLRELMESQVPDFLQEDIQQIIEAVKIRYEIKMAKRKLDEIPEMDGIDAPTVVNFLVTEVLEEIYALYKRNVDAVNNQSIGFCV